MYVDSDHYLFGVVRRSRITTPLRISSDNQVTANTETIHKKSVPNIHEYKEEMDAATTIAETTPGEMENEKRWSFC